MAAKKLRLRRIIIWLPFGVAGLLILLSFYRSFSVSVLGIASKSWFAELDRGCLILANTKMGGFGIDWEIEQPGHFLEDIREEESYRAVGYTRKIFAPRFLYTADASSATLSVPVWPPALLVAGIFAYLAIARLRHKPDEHARCEKCSYDLRAHQPGAKCPECGTVVPEIPAAAPAK